MYENREKGPNHYNLLGISRGTSTANLKRAYRNLSLELHPDKNKYVNRVQQTMFMNLSLFLFYSFVTLVQVPDGPRRIPKGETCLRCVAEPRHSTGI
jgi:hypothetical protein